MAARQTEWPSFADVFLASVVEAMRPRSDDLWIRGRLFIDGENDRGATEWLVVEVDIRPRRSITMRCDPGGSPLLQSGEPVARTFAAHCSQAAACAWWPAASDWSVDMRT